MGIWSGIKYAVNSTLGTSEFKPLDYWVKTDNTSNKNGILSQKLSYITNYMERVNTELENIVEVFDYPKGVTMNNGSYIWVLAKFIAPFTGLYAVKAWSAKTGADVYLVKDVKYATAITKTNSYNEVRTVLAANCYKQYAVGDRVDKDSGGELTTDDLFYIGETTVASGHTIFNIYASAGEPVVILGVGSSHTVAIQVMCKG